MKQSDFMTVLGGIIGNIIGIVISLLISTVVFVAAAWVVMRIIEVF